MGLWEEGAADERTALKVLNDAVKEMSER